MTLSTEVLNDIEHLATLQMANERIESLRKEVDRLNDEALKSSTKYEKIRLHLSSSNRFLFIFLDEQEEQFKRTNEFVSPAICQTYIEAANHCAKCFGRTNNIVDDAKHWYDNYPL